MPYLVCLSPDTGHPGLEADVLTRCFPNFTGSCISRIKRDSTNTPLIVLDTGLEVLDANCTGRGK